MFLVGLSVRKAGGCRFAGEVCDSPQCMLFQCVYSYMLLCSIWCLVTLYIYMLASYVHKIRV